MDEMMLSWGDVWTVVLSGISIVFVVLCILIAVVWTYGQIFHTINKRKSGKLGKNNNKKTEDKTDTSSLADNTESAQPVSVGEIPTGVIAAITAAVAAFTGGKGVVTGIKKRTQIGRRKSTEWGYAGTVSAMKKLNRVGR
jgi:Na+-transporting methylmalonyl-CoA/oxaloacetate decarboxylase gamma subunit